jgi:hypothetical protein
LLSPLYVAVIVLLPTGKPAVVHVAVPGVPEVTAVVPQPVSVLHVTVPVTASEWMPVDFLINPYWPEIVAVKVTDSPYTDGFTLDVTTVPAVALFTICPPLKVPVLVVKFESPEYTAVTVCVATVRVEMPPEAAAPEDNATGEPKALPSIMNCTVPVGVPVAGDTAATLAVKLTDWPYTDGFRLEATAVLLLAWFTVWPPLSDPLLPWWLVSPLYVAVMVSLPTVKPEVMQVATPGVPEVTAVVPQPVFVLHVTVPVTASEWMPFDFLINPYWPEIVAVKVTC